MEIRCINAYLTVFKMFEALDMSKLQWLTLLHKC